MFLLGEGFMNRGGWVGEEGRGTASLQTDNKAVKITLIDGLCT